MRVLRVAVLAASLCGAWHWWTSEGEVAPVDLGVGWGPMPDSAVVEALEFSQMGRSCTGSPATRPAFRWPRT